MKFITTGKKLIGLILIGLLTVSCLFSCSSEEKTSQKHFDDAMAYLAENKLKEAEIEFKNVIQNDPKNEDAYLKLSEVYRKLGNPKNELQALINAVTINPDNMDAQFRLGQVFILGRQTKKARETAQLILNKQPENTKALHLLATAQVQERNVDAAVKTMEDAIHIEPDNPHLYMFLGFLLYYDKKDFEKAEAAYLKAISLDNTLDEPFEELLAIYGEKRLFDKAEALLIDFTKTPDNRIQKYFRLARFYESRNQFKKAEEAYLQAIQESDKNDFLPLYNLGIFYAVTKNYPSAIDYFNRALSIKDDSNIRSDLANVYFELKDYKEAQKQATLIVKKESNHSNARLLLCKLLVVNKEYAKALESLEELFTFDKNNVPAYYLKAVCLIEEDLQDLPAQEIRMAAAGNFSTEIWKRNMAIESLKTAIELSPEYFMARLLLADLYMKNNDLVKAEKQIAYILEHTPKDLKALYMYGNLKIIEKEWEAAEKTFHQIVDMAPGFSPAYIKLGLIYASNQKTLQAIEAFQKALNLDPLDMNALRYIVNTYMSNNQRDLSIKLLNSHFNHPDLSPREKGFIYFLLGKIAVSDKSIDQAKEYFNKSIQTHENTTPAYEALARLSEIENNTFKAIKYYELILSYDPRYFPAYMNLSRLYQSENDTEKAKDYLSKVLKIKDNLPEASNDLAYLLAEEGKDLQKALHLALFAESQGPEDPNVLDTLGWVYYKQKAYDLAIYKLSESVRRNPGSALSHFHLGWAYYDTGRYEQAREHMKTALKIDPNFKGAKEARNIIGQ